MALAGGDLPLNGNKGTDTTKSGRDLFQGSIRDNLQVLTIFKNHTNIYNLVEI